ncbi:3912_t:CDS:2 [Rhizophagus irregularis]|nr:3912_t:CDS:2 [Rhizophagus irregularis]
MTVNDTAVNQSELDLLRQCNTELEAELEIDRKKIDKLKKTIGGLSSENFDLKREVAKLRKEYGIRIKKQERKNAELEDRLAKVEQGSSVKDGQDSLVVDEQSQKLEESVVDVSPSGFSAPINADTKATKDEEMDACSAFMLEQYKKSIGEKIRQRNREKKLALQGRLGCFKEAVTNTSPTFCPEVEIKVNIERLENEERVSLRLSNSSDSLQPTKNNVLFSPDSRLQAIKFTPPRTLIPRSISIKKLANSFCQVNVARGKTIIAKRAEITAWYLFSKRFEEKVVELRSNNKKLTDQTARKQIYDDMKSYFTGISDRYLCVMTCKARKINKLFGYEYNSVTLKKIKATGQSKTITSRMSETNEEMPDDDGYNESNSDYNEQIHEELRIYWFRKGLCHSLSNMMLHNKRNAITLNEELMCSGEAEIDFSLDDEIVDHKPGDIKVFDDIDFSFD